ncbi:MAG: cation:dicarboxylate symporter family transporter [Anderseniella sp.]
MVSKFLKLSLVNQVLIALILGIACGVFFGELTAPVGVLGDVYIALLQMTVLPYLIVALIGGVGRLNPAWAARIGAHGALTMLFLWVVTFVVVLAVPLSYPDWPESSAFSSITQPDDKQIDLLRLFLPSNVFQSLSENLVPAVVLFCVIMGIAIMGVEQKDSILSILDGLRAAISKMTSLAIRLSPIGIFAVSADAAGSMELDQIPRLKIFFLSLGFGWALMQFVILPVILSASTPVRYRTFMQTAHVAVLTAFATNSTLVTLPLMIACCKELLEENGLDDEESQSSVDVLIPGAYVLPNAGTLFNLGFVLFAAWFVGTPLEGMQNIVFAAVGGLFAVAGMLVAGPMLLDLFQLPSDLFQLYLIAGIFTTRLTTALGVLFAIVFCLLVTFSMAGKLNLRRLLTASAISLVAAIVALKGFSFVLGGIASPVASDGEATYQTAQPLLEPAESRLIDLPAALSEQDAARSRLDVIRERGTLRVGFRANALPYSFVNARGELAGFDIELVNAFARELGLSVEFVSLTPPLKFDVIEIGQLDLVVGGIGISMQKAVRAAYSNSYFEEQVGFVVPDHRRNQFVDMVKIRTMEPLTVAVPRRFNSLILDQLMPRAKLVKIDSAREFVTGKRTDIDALLFGAQTAFAWTLTYPEFSVTIPRGMSMRVPMAFGLPANAPRFRNTVNTWLSLNEKLGLVKLAHDHWVLGTGLKDKKPRWSVIRDVLHWIE